MGSLYVQEGAVVRCPALGFSCTLPSGWEVIGASVSSGVASFSFGGDADAQKIHFSSRASLKAYPEDHPYRSRFFADPTERQKSYPRTVQLPFGEAFVGNSLEPILFRQNRVLFTFGWSGAKAGDKAETILRALKFFPPKIERLTPTLKPFKYLHVGIPSSEDPKPPGLAEAELRGRLRAAESTRELYGPGKTRVPSMEPMARHGWANGPYQYGVLRTALGEFDAAGRNFTEAALLYSEIMADDPQDGSGRMMSLHSALLAGDRTLALQFAHHWVNSAVPENVVRDAACYQRALPLLITQRDAEARPAIEEAKAVDPKKAVVRGLGALMGAIVDANAAAYASTLEEVLKNHHGSACRKGSQTWNSLNSFLCVEAAALAVIAAWRGMALPPELPSRRATLKNLPVIGVTEFEGRPLEKGSTFDLDVDYLPEALVRAATSSTGGGANLP
jgi:hypothetical protein